MWYPYDAGLASLLAETVTALIVLLLLFGGVRLWMLGQFHAYIGLLFLYCASKGAALWSYTVCFATIALLGNALSRHVVGKVMWARCDHCDKYFLTLVDLEQHECVGG